MTILQLPLDLVNFVCETNGQIILRAGGPGSRAVAAGTQSCADGRRRKRRRERKMLPIMAMGMASAGMLAYIMEQLSNLR